MIHKQNNILTTALAICAIWLALPPTRAYCSPAFHLLDLGALGGPGSAGLGIAPTGTVTGWANLPGDAQHAFLYDGMMHDLGSLGGTISEGAGINSAGQITGRSSTANNAAIHAYLYDGTMHDLGTLGGGISAGSAINESGHVTGYSSADSNDNQFHASSTTVQCTTSERLAELTVKGSGSTTSVT